MAAAGSALKPNHTLLLIASLQQNFCVRGTKMTDVVFEVKVLPKMLVQKLSTCGLLNFSIAGSNLKDKVHFLLFHIFSYAALWNWQ